MQGTHLYAEWLGSMHFLPNGGLINNATNNVVRNVPEGLTLGQNPATNRTPTDVTRDNATFVGWRQVTSATDRTPVNPGALPLTDSQVEAIVVTVPNLYFEAVWAIDFEFFKGDMVVYSSTPNAFTPVPGATFVLERPDGSGGWIETLTATSDAAGRVLMSSSTFTIALEVPATPTVYRLRETVTPLGFMAPNGHWYVTIGGTPAVALPQPSYHPTHGYNLAFVAVPYTNDYTGETITRWLVGNMPYVFYFYKVNHLNQILPGANFTLVAFTGSGTPPQVLVTQNMLSGPGATWEVVATGTSTANAMQFRMRPGRYYHLIETSPPAGYQAPFGQWRITVSTAGAHPSLNITRISDGPPMPGIYTGDGPGVYRIVNWPAMILPLTGGVGAGTLMFTLSGSAILMVALGVSLTVWHKRKACVKKVPTTQELQRARRY